MTEFTPDNAPDNAGTDAADTAAPAGDTRPAGVAPLSEGGLLTDIEEDGVALHIVEPHTAGTILVAVAEPADMLHERPSPGESRACAAERRGGVPADPASFATPAGDHEILPRYDDLTAIVAVRLGGLGPALFFSANGISCAPGDNVIVSMEEGQAFGRVVSVLRVNPGHLDGASGDDGKIRPVVRKASEKDAAFAESNRELAAEALEYCCECVKERNLDMKLVDVLILHDRGKMVFYFTAPARIDFRELVKDLVRRYRTRIELRQIGVRHETQMVGALGNCGMVCCCRRYLRKFAPVAIKMAKEQNVFLNPVKISGICGRLLCCLAYEQEHYDEFYRSCPKLGKKYHTDAGVVRVLRASLFHESVTVFSEAGEELEYSLAEWNALHPVRPGAPPQQNQHSRRQETAGNEERRHKENGRNHHDPREEKAAFADAVAPEGGSGGMEEDEVLFAVETCVDVEDDDGVAVERRVAMAAAMAASEPDDMDDEGGGDDGGSIFGLSPARGAAVADGSAEKTDRPAGGAKRRKPRRRRPHSGFPS